MGKRLVIAEKPSVAKDLADALGGFKSKDNGEYYENDDFVISFAVGHLLELVPPEKYDEKWKRWSLKTLPMIPEKFKYATRNKKAASRLKVLKNLAKRDDVTGVINACDAGREGELIFRTIYGKLPGKLPVERLWLNSLTKTAIRAGFQELRPGSDFDALGAAAASRSEADWLIGINVTRALTGRLRSYNYNGAWTAGRVQTPTLAMVVEREVEIQAHRPVPYWEISGTFKASDHEYEGQFQVPDSSESDHNTRIFDKKEVDHYASLLDPKTKTSADETRKRQRDNPPLPFDLTSLQRATGLTAKRTQDVVQALYERHKILSYPRTDSRYLPQDQRPGLEANMDMLRDVKGFDRIVDTISKNGVQNAGRIFNDAKVSDHHAIIPVGVPAIGQLSDLELRIYRLVVSQYLAAFMMPAYWESVSRITTVHAKEALTFKSRGRVLVEPGWHLAFGREAGHGSTLAPLDPAKGAPVDLVKHEVTESETKPRPRLGDATLLSRMENAGKEIEDETLSEALHERGLGTPATRADTIERLIRRGYLAREGKSLRATAKAIRLIETIGRAGAVSLTSAELTGEMEYKLRQVEHGALDRPAYMEEVAQEMGRMVEILKNFDFDEMYAEEPELGPCPGNPGTQVIENAWGFQCTDEENGEPFFIWKDVGGHVLTGQEMKEMLEAENNEIGPVTLYPRNSRGRGYKANLKLRRLDDTEYEALVKRSKSKKEPSRWSVEIKPLEAVGQDDDEEEERVNDDVFCETPQGVPVVETNLRWVDIEVLEGKRKRPRAQLPKEVCQRPMTEDEATRYFTEGTTGFLDEFISRRGRPFRAKLILKDNGRHGFEFEPRKSKKKGKKKSKKKSSKKASTKKTSTKKASTKKASTKKTSTKKASTKKASTKKASTKKASTKKASTKKGSAKKASTKKTSTKKKASGKKKDEEARPEA